MGSVRITQHCGYVRVTTVAMETQQCVFFGIYNLYSCQQCATVVLTWKRNNVFYFRRCRATYGPVNNNNLLRPSCRLPEILVPF